MCGIAGFLVTSSTPQPENVIRRMTTAIAHRGPDDSGHFVDSGAAIGMRRLSIIDVVSGHQPMSNEDGRLVLVYNGEIFNHADLRPELEAAGHRYQNRSDSETIIHAFEQYGPECLQRMRGMFAFAIWDTLARTLFCARDRLGIKPFYYYWDGRLFAFASEIKALLEHPAISAAIRESALPEYLAFGYLSGEDTLFAGIRKLMPGHYLRIETGSAAPRLTIHKYWDALPPAQVEQRSGQEWIDECRRRLEETVQMRLMSDVPLGAFLSGGVDSSAITALMKRFTDSPVKTFSVGYSEARFSELSYAASVAKHLGTDHHEIVIGMDEFFNALPELIWHEDEPITWPSSVSLYFVSQLAAKQVKVVLTGEGSDELFGGYERYSHNMFNTRGMAAYRAVPSVVRRGVRRSIEDSSLLSASVRRKLGHTFLGREDSQESLYLDNFYCAFSAAEQDRLWQSDKRPGESPYANFLEYWNAVDSAPLLSRMLYADQKTYLVELLMKQDQMSMAASIESRVPLLDHTFVEFAASVPDQMKIRGGESKYIFKRAVEDLLPREIVYRKKMGFPTPLRQWLREDKASQLFSVLCDRDGLLASYLDFGQMEALLEKQKNGVEDVTDRIWRLLNLQIWGDVFLNGRRERWRDGLMATSPA
jgi:asparagine synthase (glutamine-hydrolysing)